MSKRFAPPPTRFGPPAASQPKAAGQPGAPSFPPAHPWRQGFAAQPMPAQPAPPPHAPPGMPENRTAVQAKPVPAHPVALGGPLPRVLPPGAPKPAAPVPRPPAGHVVQRAGGIDMGYESYDDDSGDELVSVGARKGKKGIKKSNVYMQYDGGRQKMRDLFKATKVIKKAGKRDRHSSETETKITTSVLATVVKTFETGEPGANTHILIKNGKRTTLYQANTATGVKLVVGKLKVGGERVQVRTSAARSLRIANVHTEMYILHKTTGGDPKKVRGSLIGQPVVVDKACCRMCYYWMKKAGATVHDGTNFATVTGNSRESFAWADPFTKKKFTKAQIAAMTETALDDYVTKQTG